MSDAVVRLSFHLLNKINEINYNIQSNIHFFVCCYNFPQKESLRTRLTFKLRPQGLYRLSVHRYEM